MKAHVPDPRSNMKFPKYEAKVETTSLALGG